MILHALALLIGVVAGLRAMTAPAAVAWAAWIGWLPLQDTPLAFLGFTATPWILTVLAVGELVTDQLPKTPSRKVPVQFAARLATGALSGAAIGAAGGAPMVGAAGGALMAGLLLGLIGAVVGTLGGYEVRARLARAWGRDLPAALLEDAVAVGGSALLLGGVLP